MASPQVRHRLVEMNIFIEQTRGSLIEGNGINVLTEITLLGASTYGEFM